MKIVKRICLVLGIVMAVGLIPVRADDASKAQARAAIDKGMAWLLKQQQDDGHWSNPDFPALTALPLWAMAQWGKANPVAVDKAVKYILACVHPDGAIWKQPAQQIKGGGLANYNTSICMVALHRTGRPELTPIIQKARAYVAGTQHSGGDIYKGGMGYDPGTGRPYADLSNSYVAYEAMRLTESVEDLRKEGDARADLDWAAVIEFVQRIQNRPESNDQPWAKNTTSEDYGGFGYKPDSSQAGATTNQAGAVRLRSYGSMTYAGLLSLIYAEVDRQDPRVRSAFEWAAKNWSLEENPGMGQQGYYYFFNVLSKALDAMREEQLPRPDGSHVNWRADVIQRLVSLQKSEGFWVNENNRWWEADPVLVTSYAILALQSALE